ncbi:MAG TPA: hypothetical protein VEG60_08480 [Candidatus Binatia bacterium]|nr:hypothetical protein [Candidatus Binatia bacterium]
MLILRLCFVLWVATLGVGSCTSTEVVHQWTNGAYTPSSFKKIMVIGVTKQASIRRSFEEQFVADLKAAGVNAAPSYLYIPQDGPVREAVLKQALKEAAADAVIITRLVRVQPKTEIAPGYYPPDPGMAVHPLYTTAWNDYYEPPIVYRSVLYTCETTLYDTIKNQIVWKGMAQTDSQGNISQEIKDYAEAVTSALKEKKLI